MGRIPNWLAQNDEYRAGKDHDGFMTKSLLSIMGALASFRAKSSGYGKNFPPIPKMLVCLALIITVSAAHNMLIVYAVLAVLLVHMCFLRSDWLVRTLSGTFQALYSHMQSHQHYKAEE